MCWKNNDCNCELTKIVKIEQIKPRQRTMKLLCAECETFLAWANNPDMRRKANKKYYHLHSEEIIKKKKEQRDKKKREQKMVDHK